MTNRFENTSINRNIFSYDSYRKWLTLDPLIKELLDTYFTDSSKKINTLLNSYVHANGFSYIYDNYRNWRNFDRIETKIKELKEVVVYITCLCLSLICLIQSNLLRTSGYLDALECNAQPIEGSKYWFIVFINLYMLKNFPAINVDLYEFVTKNNINGMIFDTSAID